MVTKWYAFMKGTHTGSSHVKSIGPDLGMGQERATTMREELRTSRTTTLGFVERHSTIL